MRRRGEWGRVGSGGRHVCQSGIPAFDDRLLTLKAPVHFGWDFARRVLAGRQVQGPAPTRLEVGADRRRQVTLTGELALANFVDEAGPQVKRWALALNGGFQVLHLCWPQARLRPWATPDRGFPHLCQLSTTAALDLRRLVLTMCRSARLAQTATMMTLPSLQASSPPNGPSEA